MGRIGGSGLREEWVGRIAKKEDGISEQQKEERREREQEQKGKIASRMAKERHHT